MMSDNNGMRGEPNSTRLIVYRNKYNEKGLLVSMKAIEERKTGRWEETWIREADGVMLWSWRCSECGDEPFYWLGIDSLHYCPNCGAKMEVEYETD